MGEFDISPLATFKILIATVCFIYYYNPLAELIH